MRSLKPITILLIGSLAVSSLVVILLFILGLVNNEISLVALFFIWLGSFVSTFGVFYLLVKRFIEDRLKILYRSIRKGKFLEGDRQTLSLTNDVIEEAEKQARDWTEEKNKEITKLKDQEEFRREFLGNLAHELKTPIFSIQGYLLTLLDGGLEDDKVNRRFLERASVATDRMVGIIEDLDQITKIEVDDLKMNIEHFDIVALIKEVAETIEIKAKEKEIALNLVKEYPEIIVEGDKGKIAQVLSNLVNNSINYGKVGGETRFRIYILDNIVTVEVADNGLGIEEAEIPRLFERFYRVEKSRNRHEGGSGLGLAIVKHIMESHDQSISVRSTVGVGSTFAFTLNKSKFNTLMSIK